RPGLKHITKRECTKSRVPTSASASNYQSGTISQSTLNYVTCSVDTIINIDDSPVSLETVTIRTSISAAAAIINIKHGNPTTGPVLNTGIERSRRRTCRSTMTLYYQWRAFI